MAALAEERELAVRHRVGDSPWTRQTDRKGRDLERQERFSTCLVVSCHDVMDNEACMRCLVHLPARRLVCPDRLFILKQGGWSGEDGNWKEVQ